MQHTTIPPTRVRLPLDLLCAIQEEAQRRDLKPHRLCLSLIAEGIAKRRKLQAKTTAKSEDANGVFS